jgi:Tol biopolymer transport system component/DNA-binding winged helix-turn-helix (wHTH) protein
MSTDHPVFAFGPFRLDMHERVLLRSGAPVALTPKALAILIVLVERHGHIVNKDELIRAVWPDTTVEEGNLTQNVHTLRKVLGPRDDSGIAIETVPRRGYRLNGDIRLLDELRVVPPASSVASPIRSRSHRWLWIAAALVTITAGTVYGTYRGRTSTAAASMDLPPPAVIARPINSLAGDKNTPTLSPDGDRVAFVWNRWGHNVYVSQVHSDSIVQVTYGPGGTSSPAWSPDGRSLAFVRDYVDSEGRPAAGIFITSASGGQPRMVWGKPVGVGLDWSPDGTLLVFSAKPSGSLPQQLAVIAIASGEVRWLGRPSRPGELDEYPAFSPTGDTIAFVRRGAENRILLQPLAGDDARVLPISGHAVRRLTWTSDGGALVFHSENTRRLWMASLETGETTPLPQIGEGAMEPSVARRSGDLVFRQLRRDVDLYRADLRNGDAPAIRGLARTSRFDGQGSISPDGSRVALVSGRTGTDEVWVMHADGSAPRQLTDLKTSASHPRWSPDGRSIAFAALAPASRQRHIYVVDVGTGLTRRLTAEPSNDRWPTWSRGGDWIYYASNRSGEWAGWKVRSAGGQPERVFEDKHGLKAMESPVDHFLYYSNNERTIGRRPVGGGEPEVLFTLDAAWGGEWVVTGSGIYWIDQSGSLPSLKLYDARTNQSSVVMELPAAYDYGGGFSVSPDGNGIVFGQRNYESTELLLIDRLTLGGALKASLKR